MADEDRDDLMEQAAGEFEQDGDDPESGGGGGGKKKLIFIMLGLLLLGGGGAGAYFAGLFGDEAAEGEKVAKEAAPPPTPDVVYFNLPDMLVNIDSAGARPSFLKIRASLELDADTDTAKIALMRPRIQDKFQTYLRELRLDDMRSGDGLRRLRQELLVRVNMAISPAKVRDILFRDILIQ